jgi:type I restriction enzyme S subunit
MMNSGKWEMSDDKHAQYFILHSPLIPPGYKQTEVGVIPEDWEVTTVGNEFSIQLGKMLDSEKNVGVPKPYLGNRAVQWGQIDLSDLDAIKMTPSDLQRFRLRKGDLLVCEGGEIGRAAIWNEPIEECFYQKALHRLRPIRGYNVQLMLHVLQRLASTGFLNNFVTQTSIAHLPKDKLETVPIPLPSTKAEQEAIAEALSDADAFIESLEQLIAKKRQIKQGAMQELLSGKRRLPGFATKPGYKQTEVGVIPEDWEVRRLSEGIKLLSGHHVLAQYCNTDGDGVPYITGPADFPKGVIQHTKYTTKPGTICHANDVLVTVKGSGAGTLVVSDSEYCISRQLMAVHITKWNTGYIYFSLLRDASLFGAAASGLIPGLSRGDILNKAVPIPPTKAEQTAIATILSDMDDEIVALEEKLAKARQLKQGIMQELLTGKTRLVESAR